MADFFLRSTDGSDGDNGSTWALAFATMAYAFTQMSAGDTLYVSQNHSETQATAMTLSPPGTAASPVRVICGNDAAEPPTAVAKTAIVATSAASNIDINTGHTYFYGTRFMLTGAAGSSARIKVLDGAAGAVIFDNCLLSSGRNDSSDVIVVATVSDQQSFVTMLNTDIAFAHVNQKLEIGANVLWSGGALNAGSAIPTTLLRAITTTEKGTSVLRGVDLSQAGAGKNLILATGMRNFVLENCKLGASVTITTGTLLGPEGGTIRLVNCDSADTNYRYHKEDYQGIITQETTIVRTGGASDGTTPISRKMVSTANPEFFFPLESDPCVVWNETVGSSVTATIEIITDNVTLQDDEAWIEVEYLGTSGFPLSLFASDRAADILATPANQTSSSVDWTTTGLSTPLKQKLSVAFTPQEKGPIKVRVMLAKASTTMYFNPKIDIS